MRQVRVIKRAQQRASKEEAPPSACGLVGCRWLPRRCRTPTGSGARPPLGYCSNGLGMALYLDPAWERPCSVHSARHASRAWAGRRTHLNWLCAGLTLCGLRCRAAQEAEFERDYQRMMRDALDTAKRSLPKDGAKGVEIVPPVTAHKVGRSVGL